MERTSTSGNAWILAAASREDHDHVAAGRAVVIAVDQATVAVQEAIAAGPLDQKLYSLG